MLKVLENVCHMTFHLLTCIANALDAVNKMQRFVALFAKNSTEERKAIAKNKTGGGWVDSDAESWEET